MWQKIVSVFDHRSKVQIAPTGRIQIGTIQIRFAACVCARDYDPLNNNSNNNNENKIMKERKQK